MADNGAKAGAFFDAWERRDFDACGAQLGGDVVFNDWPRVQVVKGQDAVRDWYASWATAFPDAVAGATVVAASDDTVAVEGLFAGTNTANFGPLPPTGKAVSLPWANVLRFDDDGRIVGGSAYYDQLSLLVQLGHIEARVKK